MPKVATLQLLLLSLLHRLLQCVLLLLQRLPCRPWLRIPFLLGQPRALLLLAQMQPVLVQLA
jgi:hypothetical protein